MKVGMSWKFASYYLVSNNRIVVFVIQGVYFANLNVNESFIYYLIGRIISRFKGFREWNSGYLGTFHTCCKLQWVHVLLFWEKCSEKHRCIKERKSLMFLWKLLIQTKRIFVYIHLPGALSLSPPDVLHIKCLCHILSSISKPFKFKIYLKLHKFSLFNNLNNEVKRITLLDFIKI